LLVYSSTGSLQKQGYSFKFREVTVWHMRACVGGLVCARMLAPACMCVASMCTPCVRLCACVGARAWALACVRGRTCVRGRLRTSVHAWALACVATCEIKHLNHHITRILIHPSKTPDFWIPEIYKTVLNPDRKQTDSASPGCPAIFKLYL